MGKTWIEKTRPFVFFGRSGVHVTDLDASDSELKTLSASLWVFLEHGVEVEGLDSSVLSQSEGPYSDPAIDFTEGVSGPISETSSDGDALVEEFVSFNLQASRQYLLLKSVMDRPKPVIGCEDCKLSSDPTDTTGASISSKEEDNDSALRLVVPCPC